MESTAPSDSGSNPLTIDQAADAGRRYLAETGNSDLQVNQVIEFTNGFYISVVEKSTKAGAFGLHVSRNSGTVTRERGPDLIWNTKYGLGNGVDGMMGNIGSGGMMGNIRDPAA